MKPVPPPRLAMMSVRSASGALLQAAITSCACRVSPPSVEVEFDDCAELAVEDPAFEVSAIEARSDDDAGVDAIGVDAIADIALLA